MSDRDATDRLGPEVLRCRLKSQRRILQELGMIQLFYMGPFFALLYAFLFGGLAALGARALGMRGTIWQEPVWGPILLAVALLSFGGALWFMYVFPRSDFLVLHERGFRYRILLKRRIVSFSELSSFEIGMEFSRFLGAIVSVNRFTNPDLYQTVQGARRRGATLRLQDGRTIKIPGFLSRFDLDDTLRFLAWIEQRQPDLIAKADA